MSIKMNNTNYQLTEIERKVYQLFKDERRTPEEIAQDLDISVESVKDHLLRAGAEEGRKLAQLCREVYKLFSEGRSLEEIAQDLDIPLETVRDRLHDVEKMIRMQRRMQRRINECINQLSAIEQKIFRLHHYEGIRIKEIAQNLDISEETVRDRLCSSLEKLRELLAE